jgi:Tfp pilus assembly protein PilF/glutathione synthase/RimK-type ligase-like ATP-grasp enzyme
MKPETGPKVPIDATGIESELEHAGALEVSGHTDMARLAYAAILAKAPGHARTLNALGRLLYKTGSRTAAQMAFADAAARNPNDISSHLNLAFTFTCESRFDDARRHYEQAVSLDPGNAMAHQGLAYVLSELGDEDAASRHRGLGFREPVIAGAYYGEGEPVRVLLLCSAVGGTVSTSQFLDERIFLTTTVVVELFDPATSLPAHHVAFNAIGDADRCGVALLRAAEILRQTNAPIVNAPEAVMATSRLANAARLGTLAGVLAPRMQLISSRNITTSTEFTYPVLLRAPGFHTGRFFVKVDRLEDLEQALRTLPEGDLLAIEYLDGRGTDGKYRKFRVMSVDGELYPLHLAISNDWKVHYGTAQMTQAEHREEEARFLEDLPAFVGPNVIGALRAIAQTLGLQYAGIDFGIDAAGNLLLYEANATMTVVVPERHDTATYRRLPAERIILAAMKMLARLAASGAGVKAVGS